MPDAVKMERPFGNDQTLLGPAIPPSPAGSSINTIIYAPSPPGPATANRYRPAPSSTTGGGATGGSIVVAAAPGPAPAPASATPAASAPVVTGGASTRRLRMPMSTTPVSLTTYDDGYGPNSRLLSNGHNGHGSAGGGHHRSYSNSNNGFGSRSDTVDDDPDSSTASPSAEPQRKKQKRNKPTLSCYECVERKTKCDRGRPHCLACIKRQTECKYAHVANLLEETTRHATNGRRMTKAPKKKANGQKSSTPNAADRGFSAGRVNALGSVATSTGLLSNVPYSSPGQSNVFGIGSEHPFANYWTFLVPRGETDQGDGVDAAFVALIFVMLALGTQFVTTTSPTERKQTAEFYASAANQALRMSSYLSSASIRSIQAMVLITYFLINDNHASDGWAFAGILMRQAYAMGLHRDPNIVTPHASYFEKQQRRKLWQAVLLQDTFVTVLLSLPPNATHTDVRVEDLVEDDSSIASDHPTDIAYVRGSWTLANLVQESICSPRSLDVPICSTARHKSKLIADFRAVYRSFPDMFRSWDPEQLTELAHNNKRVVRQTLFLSSNYFHNLMLAHASESLDVPVNVRGTLEAAHDAITAFFVLFSLFEAEARVWWVFNHRAFLEALCIGNVLREASREPGGEENLVKDPLFMRARADIYRMIDIMEKMSDGEQGSETARTRVIVLRDFVAQ
ncbi:fungal-specific transcription factor domain-containing protein [Bombardia bombarda]|uniref:Fungal-specific transcription factor domain-containing protein n=1 Tax=Bombardia bombarda TaxID=252184 RepID=A0AA39XB00_9PEZI|nr:fungal-specific transcription factor domain-containing protein [Bombardia bombarda]